MTLGEALYMARDIVEEVAENISDRRLYEVTEILRYAVDSNLEELIQEAVTVLSSIPKEGTQELAIALTMVIEGGE